MMKTIKKALLVRFSLGHCCGILLPGHSRRRNDVPPAGDSALPAECDLSLLIRKFAPGPPSPPSEQLTGCMIAGLK